LAIAAFSILALAAIAGALLVVTARSPIYSALSLVGVLAVTAVFYLMLSAPFLAVLQVLVYAGAIMVLFIFVIMLLSLRTEEGGEVMGLPTGARRVVAVVFSLLLLGQLAYLGATLVLSGRSGGGPPGEILGTPVALGTQLFQRYLVPFQMTGILLLVAIVGAVAITRRHGRRGLEGTMAGEED
jgi:NADH-quinone oxidoreductase subunit J